MTMVSGHPGARIGAHPGAVAATVRDPRLDVFRGLAMFIILMAHTPGNFLTLWIPARFGFSDATEIFVFCSGMASAIAFGRIFETRGWLLGSARVAFRCWQVYWAHIGTFLVVATAMAAIDFYGGFGKSYVASLNLVPFFERTPQQLIGLLTLTYVPNYFDILPMYLGVLAMMPVVMALALVSRWLVAAFVAGLWLAANWGGLGLPAEPWSDRQWFFNPFGWQLIFFTGFAFMRGWIPAPPVRVWMLVAAGIIVLATVPFAYYRILNAVPELRDAANAIKFLTTKSEFGLLRYVHFLALAYLAWSAAGVGGHRFRPSGIGLAPALWAQVLEVVQKVGQQSLAVFMFSMVMARLMGFALDLTGRATVMVLTVNLIGAVSLVLVAYGAAWFKSHPWKRRAA